MKLIFKVVVCFVVVAMLLLAVLMYLEQKDGLQTSPTAVWEDIKSAGKSAFSWLGGIINGDKLKESAADILEEGASMIKGESPSPSPSPSPAV